MVHTAHRALSTTRKYHLNAADIGPIVSLENGGISWHLDICEVRLEWSTYQGMVRADVVCFLYVHVFYFVIFCFILFQTKIFFFVSPIVRLLIKLVLVKFYQWYLCRYADAWTYVSRIDKIFVYFQQTI